MLPIAAASCVSVLVSYFLLPYAVLILVPYFASFPSELEDAARIDGCTRFTAFLRVLLPLSTPGLAACGVGGMDLLKRGAGAGCTTPSIST